MATIALGGEINLDGTECAEGPGGEGALLLLGESLGCSGTKIFRRLFLLFDWSCLVSGMGRGGFVPAECIAVVSDWCRCRCRCKGKGRSRWLVAG